MQINRRILFVGLMLMLTAPLIVGRTKASPIQRAPAEATRRPNPYSEQPTANQAGAKLYRRECATCHGLDGRGFASRAPALISPAVREASPGALFWVLRNGSIYRGMPSFSHLPEQQRWQIVTYLKGLTLACAPRSRPLDCLLPLE